MITQVFQEWEDSSGAVTVRLKWPKTWLLSVTVNAKLSLASKLTLRTSYVERTPGVTVWVSSKRIFKREKISPSSSLVSNIFDSGGGRQELQNLIKILKSFLFWQKFDIWYQTGE